MFQSDHPQTLEVPSLYSPISLTNKTCVVTGATSGIGEAICNSLVSQGAHVFLLGRNTQKLEQLTQNYQNGPGKVTGCEVDLSQPESIVRLVETLTHQTQSIDVLIHAAGMYATGKIADTPAETFDQLYQVNVRAPYELTQQLLPAMTPDLSQVVFVNSTAGIKSGANVSQYAATKHALKAMADSLRMECNRDHVRVVTVYPGRTATKMGAEVFRSEGREDSYKPDLLLQPKDIAEVVLHTLKLPQTAEVTDLYIRPFIKSY